MALKPGYKQTEVGVIPEEWQVKSLAEVADKIMVGIASAATHAYRAKGVPMFRNQNIKDGFLDDSDLLFIASDYETTYRNKRLRAGDLLTMRTGYPGVTAIVPPQYESAQSFTTLITRPRQQEASSAYLCHFINSEFGQQFFIQSQIGGAQKNVNAGTLRWMPVPLPEPPEQSAIATALSDVDGLLGGLDRLIAKKRDLKQAAMQQLLTGQTRLLGFHGDWEVRLLPEVCKFRGGKAHEQYIAEFGQFVCVNSKFISTEGKERKYSTENFCCAEKNDILMVMSDLPNGRALAKAYLVEQNNLYAVNQRVCALTTYRDCAQFLFYILNRNPYFLKFDNGVSQTHLLNHVFQKCPIRIPPNVTEQTAIAAVLMDMDTELAALEQRRGKTRALKQAMMQELLTGKTRLV